MPSLNSFEELDCYKKCRQFRIAVSHEARKWPGDEKRRLVDQVLRSSRSTTANIAEGFGRHHHQENLQFCRQARGSLHESLEHLITACDEGVITEATLAAFRTNFGDSLKLLNGYIAYLAKIAVKK